MLANFDAFYETKGKKRGGGVSGELISKKV